jgi:hypothetical protein
VREMITTMSGDEGISHVQTLRPSCNIADLWETCARGATLTNSCNTLLTLHNSWGRICYIVGEI